MAEAEEVLLEGARFATAQAAALWRRHRGEPPGPPALIDVQARLELYVAALCPGAPPIGVSRQPSIRSRTRRKSAPPRAEGTPRPRPCGERVVQGRSRPSIR